MYVLFLALQTVCTVLPDPAMTQFFALFSISVADSFCTQLPNGAFRSSLAQHLISPIPLLQGPLSLSHVALSNTFFYTCPCFGRSVPHLQDTTGTISRSSFCPMPLMHSCPTFLQPYPIQASQNSSMPTLRGSFFTSTSLSLLFSSPLQANKLPRQISEVVKEMGF